MKRIILKTLVILGIISMSLDHSAQAQSKKTPAKPPAKKETKPPAKPAAKPVVKAEVNYKVAWGPDLKLKGEAPTEILLYDNGSFYATTSMLMSSSTSYLSKFNDKMDLVLQTKIETEESNKDVSKHRVFKVMEFNKEIYAVTSEWDKKSKRRFFYIEKINLTTLIPDGKKKKIYEIDYSVDKNRDDDLVSIETDIDNKYIVICDQPESEKKQNVKFYATAIDKTFSIVWKKDVELPFKADKNNKIISMDKYVDPASNLYLVTKVYDDEGEKKKHKEVVDGELNYDYHIYMMGKEIPSFVDYPFDLKDKAVMEVKLNANDKGQIVACGFYGDIDKDKGKVSGGKGVFHTIIDPQKNEIKSQSYKKFETEVFTAGLSAKRASKQEKKMDEGKRDETDRYRIDDLIARKDGGTTMIAESFDIHVSTSTMGGRTTRTTTYTYANIIVTKINASGEIEWTTVIPKKQVVSISSGGMSFGPITYTPGNSAILNAAAVICSYLKFDEGDDTYDFFFNDHKDNLNATSLATKGAEPMNGKLKNMRFVRQVVYPDGTLSKREVAFKVDEEDEDTRFCPPVSQIVSDHEIVLYGVDHRKDKFARITYTNLPVKD